MSKVRARDTQLEPCCTCELLALCDINAAIAIGTLLPAVEKRPAVPSIRCRHKRKAHKGEWGPSWGCRHRGLDTKASANRAAADKASSAEAKAAVDRWNAQLAAGRDILWSPTIRAVLLAGTSCRCVLPRRCSGRGDQYSAIRVSQNALPVLVSRRSRARDARSTGRKR